MLWEYMWIVLGAGVTVMPLAYYVWFRQNNNNFFLYLYKKKIYKNIKWIKFKKIEKFWELRLIVDYWLEKAQRLAFVNDC